MTMEQILEKIKQNRGEDALRDGKQLIGLFMDYSKNQQPQVNALRIFLSCQGNMRILNLRGMPPQTQQVGFHHLIQEMVNNHYMQEAAALDVCSIFWRVAVGTEPPVSVDNIVSEPMPPVSEPKSVPEQEPNPEPCFQVPSERPIQQPRKQPHTPLEITAFSIGWLLIGLLLIPFVSALHMDLNPVSNPALIALGIFMVLFGAMQYLLWNRKILRFCDYCPFGIMAFFGLMMALLVPGMVQEDGGAITLMDVGLEAGGLYWFLWNLIPILEKRKIKRGGKK